MTLRPFFEWMDGFESSVSLRESLNAYPILLTAHVVSMCLFAGIIMFWDLRLIGVALKKVPVMDIRTRLFPWSVTGFLISAVTGLLLFYSQPMRYFGNYYFWMKFCFLVLAGLNILWFDWVTLKSVKKWGNDVVTPPAARFAGVASLLLWTSIVVTGRLIAYSGLVPDWWRALELN